MTNYYKIPIPDHDKSEEWAAHQANPTTYPGTVGVRPAPLSGQTNCKIAKRWWDYTRSVNKMMGTVAGWDKARKVWSGWINAAAQDYYKSGEIVPDYPTIYPVIEGIATVGNYVKGTGVIKNNSIQIASFSNQDIPPSVNDVNPTTHPWLFDEMHSTDGGYAPEGERFFFPRLVKGDNVGWIEDIYLDRVDSVPAWIPSKEIKMISRAHGIDISKWNSTFRLPTNPPFPVDFVVQRASYAMRKDERFDEFKQQVLAAPISGAYHYFSSGANWLDQAKLFLALVGDKYDMLVWDVEPAYNKVDAVFFNGALNAIDYVAAQTCKKVLLYTNPTTYRPMEAAVGVTKLKNYSLWLAQYYYFPSPTKDPNMSGMLRKTWDMWQYSARGKGAEYGVGSASVDLNVYNGTLEEMKYWLKIDPTLPVEPGNGELIKAAIEDTYQDAMDAIRRRAAENGFEVE